MTIPEAQVNPILQELCTQLPDIKAIALTQDEKVVAKALPPACDVETMGTVISSTLLMMENTIHELGHQKAEQVLIKGKQGFIVLHVMAGQTVLMVFTNPSIVLHTLFAEIQRIAQKIGELLERG
jgi:predicted regulator of Ras-like GTPase activity (Roadblock/LC7/MglB family)